MQSLLEADPLSHPRPQIKDFVYIVDKVRTRSCLPTRGRARRSSTDEPSSPSLPLSLPPPLSLPTHSSTTPRPYNTLSQVENNPAIVTSAAGVVHPAWAGRYDLRSNAFTPMDLVSNAFCAGGIVLGNGSWVNVGGNARVTTLGVGVAENAPNPYGSQDGGKAVRMFTPCGDDDCAWTDDVNAMPTASRWYPTVETLPTGDAIIIGGGASPPRRRPPRSRSRTNSRSCRALRQLRQHASRPAERAVGRVLAVEGRAVQPELPRGDDAGQPLPAHVAHERWPPLHAGASSSTGLRRCRDPARRRRRSKFLDVPQQRPC